MNENGGKSSTILLTVIGIATLLVVVVGATFAYFAAQVNGNDTATSVTITAAEKGSRVETIQGTELTFADKMYPDNDKVWAYQDVTLTLSNANTDAKGQTKYTFTLTGNNGFPTSIVIDGNTENPRNLNKDVVVQLVKADDSADFTILNGYGTKKTLLTDTVPIAEVTVDNNKNYTFKFRINLYYLNATEYNQNTNENYTAAFYVNYSSEGIQ